MILLYLASIVSGQTWPAPQYEAPPCPPPVQIVPEIVSKGDINSAVLKPSVVIDNIKVGPVKVDNAYRIFRSDLTVTNSHFDGITGTNIKRDALYFEDLRDSTISNFDFRFRAEPQTGSQLPEGIALHGGSNIVIRDGYIHGFRMVPGKSYTNGDGIASEGAVKGLHIERVTSEANSDGGFDLKGVVSLTDTIAIGNSRNYRFWHQVDAGTITSINPRGYHVWLGRGAVVTIRKLIARSDNSKPVIALDGQTTLNILECELDVPAGTMMVRVESSGNKVTLGPGCKLP